MDGWGYREDPEGNAVALADTPFFDRLWAEFPRTLIHASEERVGLPRGQMGNSEVGHLNLGAGPGGVPGPRPDLEIDPRRRLLPEPGAAGAP